MNADQLLLLKQIAELSEARRVLAVAGIGTEQLPAIDKHLLELCSAVCEPHWTPATSADNQRLVRGILQSFIEVAFGQPADAVYVRAAKEFLAATQRADSSGTPIA